MLAYILVYLPFYHALYFLSMSNHENSTTKNEPKTLKDKPFWAVYLNMAVHNAYIALSFITEKIGGSPVAESSLTEMACIKCLSDEKRDTSKMAKSIKLLDRHFPFLLASFHKEKQANNNLDETKHYSNVMTQYLTLLKDLRNTYSHQESGGSLAWDNSNDGNITIKKCFESLESLFGEAIKKNMSSLSLFSEADLAHLASKNENDVYVPKFHYGFIDETKDEYKYTEEGLAFFICLFLEKSYAYPFLQKIEGFKADYLPHYQATKAVFTTFTIRVPRPKINDTISDPVYLALDMLNELPKCPKNLFALLSNEDKQSFFVKKNNDEKEYEQEEDTSEKNKLVRNKNRFSYFALSYIDYQELLGNLRFQIDMGVFYHHIQTKKMVDGSIKTRQLGKKIHIFDRLPNLDTKKKEAWKGIIRDKADDQENPYMSNTYLHYHIVDGQVGLKDISKPIKQQDGTYKRIEFPAEVSKSHNNYQPDFWISEAELPALIFLLYLQKIKEDKDLKPDFQMQKYKENLHKLYKDIKTLKEEYDNDTSGKAFENLKKKIQDMYQFQIKTSHKETSPKNLLGQEIQYWGYVSNEIIEYIKTKDLYIKEDTKINFEKYCERKIQDLIQDSRNKRIELDNHVENQNKSNESADFLREGNIAKLLANDMLYLQVSTDGMGKDKLNAEDFNILQSGLAQKFDDKQYINSLLTQAKLIHSGDKHPFLQKINIEDFTNIISYYRRYLYKRKEYFEICAKEKRYDTYYFLKPNRQKWKDKYGKYDNKTKSNKKGKEHLTKLEERLLDKPINIPRGFFMNLLKKWFAKYGNDAMKQIATQKKTNTKGHQHAPNEIDTNGANTVFLIQQYLLHEKNGDDAQIFYRNYKRIYPYIERLIQKINNFPIDNSQKTLEKSISIIKTEFLGEKLEHLKKKLAKNPNDLGYKAKYERKLKVKHKLAKINENEKKIRLTKVQDMLTFLMAEVILFNQKEEKNIVNFDFTKGKYQLKNLQASDVEDNKNLLTASLDIYYNYSVKEMTDEGDLKNEKHTIKIFQNNLKIKDYGVFIRYIKDRRLNPLFLWLEDKAEIAIPDLKTELLAYDKYRIEALECILAFEAKALTLKDAIVEITAFYAPIEQENAKIQADIDKIKILKNENVAKIKDYDLILGEHNKCKKELKNIKDKAQKKILEQQYLDEKKLLSNNVEKENEQKREDLRTKNKKYSEEIKDKEDQQVSTPDRFQKILEAFYIEYPPKEGEEEKKMAKAIRNAFMHNQYPRPQQIGLALQHRANITGIAKEITEKGKALFQRYIDAMKG